MSENKQPAPALSESAPQPDRRDEATAIINQMIAEGLISPGETKIIQFEDAVVLCLPDAEKE